MVIKIITNLNLALSASLFYNMCLDNVFAKCQPDQAISVLGVYINIIINV